MLEAQPLGLLERGQGLAACPEPRERAAARVGGQHFPAEAVQLRQGGVRLPEWVVVVVARPHRPSASFHVLIFALYNFRGDAPSVASSTPGQALPTGDASCRS